MSRPDAIFTCSFHLKQIGWFRSMRRWHQIVLGMIIIFVSIPIALWFRPDPHLAITFSMDDAVEAVAMSPDAQYLAAGDREGHIIFWNRLDTTQRHAISAHHGAVTTLAFSPDGQLLASGGQDGGIRLWEIPTGQQRPFQIQIIPNQSLQPLTQEHVNPFQVGISQIVFSSDGETLVAGGSEGHILVLRLDTGQVVFDLRGHPVPTNPGHYWDVRRVGVSLDGRWVASGAFSDDIIAVWDIHTGQLVASLDLWYAGHIEALVFSSDGQNLIVIPDGADVQIWSIPHKQRVWSGGGLDVPSVAVTADATIFAHGGPTYADSFTAGLPIIGQPDATIYLSRLRNPAPTNQDGRCAIPLSPNATSVTLTPCPRIEPFLALRGHQGAVSALAFSHDQQWLVSGSWDKTVRVWHLR